MEEQTELGPSGNRGIACQLTRLWEDTRLSCPPLPEASPVLPLLSCGRSVAGTTDSSRLYFQITVPPAQRRRGRVLSPQSPASAPALLRASCPHSPYHSPPAGSSLLPGRCPPPASLFFCRTTRGLSPPFTAQSLQAGCCHPRERTPSSSPIGPLRSPPPYPSGCPWKTSVLCTPLTFLSPSLLWLGVPPPEGHDSPRKALSWTSAASLPSWAPGGPCLSLNLLLLWSLCDEGSSAVPHHDLG